MLLLPIDIDEMKNTVSLENPECIPILDIYPGYYKRVGYNRFWIGYFATIDGQDIVGVAGYKRKATGWQGRNSIWNL
jgi:ribosomal-protein-alanine N-acetyltransferase